MPTEEHEDGRGPAGEKPVRAERPLPDDPGQDRPADESIPGERPLLDDPGQDRPADAARRALRAARERAGQTTTSATQGAVPGTESAWGAARAAAGKLAEPENPGQRGRPAEAAGPETWSGDTARAALRGATTPAGDECSTGPSAGPGPEAPDVAQARRAAGDHKGGRPGDVARAALRAAGSETRPGDVARAALRRATALARGERPSGA
ncbi:hypothetical protein ACWCRB_13575, partial [Streptomyces sp. NPDC002156]